MNNEKNKLAEGYKVTVDRFGKNWWKKASSPDGPSNKRTYTGQKGRNIVKAVKKREKSGDKVQRERDLRSGKKLSSRMVTNYDTRSNTRVSVKKESTAYHSMGYVIAEAFKVYVDREKNDMFGADRRTFTGKKARNIVKAMKKRSKRGGTHSRNFRSTNRDGSLGPDLDQVAHRTERGEKAAHRTHPGRTTMNRKSGVETTVSVNKPKTRLRYIKGGKKDTKGSVQKNKDRKFKYLKGGQSEHSIYKQVGMALAEAFAGPIASKYGDERGVKSVAKKTRDRRVRAGAVQAQKTIDKKVGVKTNPRAKDLVQVAMNKRRKSRSLPPGPFKTPRSYNK